jgi:predicted house-cleaning noncanonical NTP pyrophosphatase (MazG superfamily)
MEYHKLVRDRIPDIIQAKGDKFVARIAGQDEFLVKLKEKLREEADEFIASGSPEELADLYEVIDTLMAEMNIDKKEVLEAQEKKRGDRGGFAKKIILESSEKKS